MYAVAPVARNNLGSWRSRGLWIRHRHYGRVYKRPSGGPVHCQSLRRISRSTLEICLAPFTFRIPHDWAVLEAVTERGTHREWPRKPLISTWSLPYSSHLRLSYLFWFASERLQRALTQVGTLSSNTNQYSKVVCSMLRPMQKRMVDVFPEPFKGFLPCVLYNDMSGAYSPYRPQLSLCLRLGDLLVDCIGICTLFSAISIIERLSPSANYPYPWTNEGHNAVTESSDTNLACVTVDTGC